MVEVQPGILVRQIGMLARAAARMFSVRDKVSESWLDQRADERGQFDYQQTAEINFSEIFALRLSNYALSLSSASVEDDAIGELLSDFWGNAQRWLPLSIGVGRAYLVPYTVGGKVYTDIISDAAVVSTSRRGDDIIGFVCVADKRAKGKRTFYRLAHYDFNPDEKTFTVSQRAVTENGSECPLTVIDEWATILPDIVFRGCDKPLFGIVDGARMARDGDKSDGVPITYGCAKTIEEIREHLAAYRREFNHKQSVLGVDKSMIDVKAAARGYGFRALPTEYIQVDSLGKMGGNGGDLFSVFSPEIRDAAYQARLLELFGRLEKQVGTSSGILTPADTAQGTATQVRRAMADTIAMVDRIRRHIMVGIDGLVYGWAVMLNIIGIRADDEATVTYLWHDIAEDAQSLQGLWFAGLDKDIVSASEMRRKFFFPDESEEETAAALEMIRKSKPQMPDFSSMFHSEGGGNE